MLRGPAQTVDAAAAKAVDAVAKEGARQAKTVRRAGRLAKRDVMPKAPPQIEGPPSSQRKPPAPQRRHRVEASGLVDKEAGA